MVRALNGTTLGSGRMGFGLNGPKTLDVTSGLCVNIAEVVEEWLESSPSTFAMNFYHLQNCTKKTGFWGISEEHLQRLID